MKIPKSDLDKINTKAKFIKALEIKQKLDSYRILKEFRVLNHIMFNKKRTGILSKMTLICVT